MAMYIMRLWKLWGTFLKVWWVSEIEMLPLLESDMQNCIFIYCIGHALTNPVGEEWLFWTGSFHHPFETFWFNPCPSFIPCRCSHASTCVPQAQFTAGTSGRMPELFLLQSFLILLAKMFGLLLQNCSLSSNRLQPSSLERLDSLSHSLYSHSDTCSLGACTCRRQDWKKIPTNVTLLTANDMVPTPSPPVNL